MIKNTRAVKKQKKYTDNADSSKSLTELPVLPARDLVAFPSVIMAIYVSTPSCIDALNTALKTKKLVFLVLQKNQETNDPTTKDLHRVGVIAHIVRTLRIDDIRLKVIIQGLSRAKVETYRKGKFLNASVRTLTEKKVNEKSKIVIDTIKRIKENLQLLVEKEHISEEMLLVTEEAQNIGNLADVILAHYRLAPEVSQLALEELDPLKRLKTTDKIIIDDINQFLISEKIKDKARDELNKGQKEYYLREQIKQIQVELGETDEVTEDLKVLKKQIINSKLTTPAYTEATKLLSRLEKMSSESSEYTLLRNYIEWIYELPWSVKTKDSVNFKKAKDILDLEHFGLGKAKERILDYLSVRKLNKKIKGPILCLVGPPGVGKTSLGNSIATALNRKFYKMSLGGLRDEAEIRGHRRTYIGAMPGRIIQGLKQAGSKNCVFVLDEIDKIGTDFRGDPASALLEVLDPNQNKEFRDHYLNIAFDLSEVLFIATANTVDTIPEALLDRLEVLYISGYTTEEKLEIVKKFILPRQLLENGINDKKIYFTDDSIKFVIERYTAEAGVRNLDREIGTLCRKVARQISENQVTLKLNSKLPKGIYKKFTHNEIIKYLGNTKYDPEIREGRDLVGVARGLAWTMNGGEIMTVEASIAKGSGNLTLTGQLGNVMQESAQAALFYARSNAKELGLNPNFHQKFDFHIHVPSGATPKDGPSAGITIVCALVSALSGKKLSSKIAMTGEITLRGNVLPVGGLKEKCLAALRYGIKRVIIPSENIKDIDDIPLLQREKIEFLPVNHVGEVISLAILE